MPLMSNVRPYMTTRQISKVVLDPDLGLLVEPLVEGHGAYEYIYRVANGLRWNREHHAFCAYEPARWQPTELLQHIAATVAAELGEELQFTSHTSWQGVPSDLQGLLRQALRRAG